jgi:hypothetical protein
MQIATKPFIVCVLATAIATFSSRGADTDAQIKAREALRQRINELNAQPATTNAAAPTPSATPSKAPESQPPPVAKPTPEPVATTPEPVATTPVPTQAPDTVKTVPPPVSTRIEAPPTRTTPPGQAQAPAPVVRTTRQPKPKPAPVAKTPKNAPTSSGQVTATRPDSEKVAKARQALEEKMRELNAQGSQPAVASQPPVAQPEVAAQPVSPPVVATQPPSNAGSRTPEIISTSRPSISAPNSDANEPLPTPPPVNKSGQASQNKPQSKPQPPKRPPTQTAQVPEPRQRYTLPPGPPAPVSADKVQKLDTLLQQYRADRITPEQYQQERAKILAGP